MVPSSPGSSIFFWLWWSAEVLTNQLAAFVTLRVLVSSRYIAEAGLGLYRLFSAAASLFCLQTC